ncbi:MAG: AraC family transcriptional regulator [Myxococcales bacterium]
MDRAPSVISSWTRIIIDALEAAGIPSEPVLEHAGFRTSDFSDPNARHPLAATQVLWRAAALAFSDPACGLRISGHVRPTTFHALGYAVMASVTLREGLHRLVRYSALIGDGATLELVASEDSARLVFHIPSEQGASAPEGIDAIMSLIVRTCRTLTDRSFSPDWVEQRRPVPRDLAPYERFFRCPLRFAAESNAITFSAAALDRPLPSANPELARHNDDLVRRSLAEVTQGNLVDRVRGAIASDLSGEISPGRVARALGVSERSLQRHLAKHGTTFAEVLNETRREVACAYLREPRWSITEVAFLLGFEDASSFARAFRRWTGSSPTEFRAQGG